MSKTGLLPQTLIGADTFYELVTESTVIVDKTLLIKEFLENKNKVNLITYPRRWGKTINMDMIKTFLEIEIDKDGNELPEEQKLHTEIFANGKWQGGQKISMNIWHEKDIVEKYFGKYPVISITFKDARGNNYQEIENLVKYQVVLLYGSHRYLEQYLEADNTKLSASNKKMLARFFSGEIDIDDIKNSLKFLSELLYMHFKKNVFILIDEYDTSINDANLSFNDENERQKTLKLFRGILGGALKGNLYIAKGLVTGILRIARADLFSGVNNFQEYGITTKEYSRHYGFTQKEMGELFVSYNVAEDLAQDIKNWYNGYNFHGIEIYNPWSILKCLTALQYRVMNYNQSYEQTKTEILQSYWEESGSVNFISKLLKIPAIKAKITALIEGNPIYFDLITQINIEDFKVLRAITVLIENVEINIEAINLLFSYLFLAGYLTPANNNQEFRLPNNEIRHEFGRKLLVYYKKLYNVDPQLFHNASNELQAVLSCDKQEELTKLMDNFIASLQILMNKFPNFVQLTEEKINDDNIFDQVVHGNEDIIHGMLLYIILQTRTASILASEMYIGKGRADLVFIDKTNKRAAVWELKYNKSSNEGLEQIKNMEYAQKLQENFETFLIGINILPDKQVEVKYEVVK